MVRGALWLAGEVGVGGIFTKEDIRRAFPGIAQADRRIRDLRDYGWVIHTNTDDASLRPGEQRLVTLGVAVWDKSARRGSAPKTVSSKQRHATLAADSYQCTMCGIAGGEAYPDNPTLTAVLTVALRNISQTPSPDSVHLATLCKRCFAGAEPTDDANLDRFLTDVRNLDETDRQRLRRWIRRGRRGPTPLDRAWTDYRRLPPTAKEVALNDLGDQ